MEQLKKWVALAALASVAVLAVGWFLLVSPKREEAAGLRAQAAEQVATNSRLETELQVLQSQAKDLPKEQAKLAAVAAKIPDNPALPGLVRSLLEAAESSGVQLVSVAPGAPELVVPAAPVAPPAPAAAQAAPAPEGTPADPAAPGTAPVGPAGQLANIPVAISVFGDYFEVQQFVAALETLPRALRLTGLNVAPGASPTAGEGADVSTEDGRSLLSTLNGYVFMAADRPTPQTATAPTATAEGQPAAATTATPAG